MEEKSPFLQFLEWLLGLDFEETPHEPHPFLDTLLLWIAYGLETALYILFAFLLVFFVIPDDIKVMALPVLRHRLAAAAEMEIERLSADEALLTILDRIEAPRV